MNIKLMAVVMTLFASSCMYAGFDYGAAWKEVEKHLEEKRSKSALKTVNEILSHARAEKEDIQYVKATLFRTRLVLNTEELGLEHVIQDLKSATDAAQGPVKGILHSYSAEVIQEYYNQNRYRFEQRTALMSETDDIRTWSPANYRAFISDNYIASIENMDTDVSIEKYKELLADSKASLDLRPKLWDVLNDRALSYFSNQYLQDGEGLDRFLVNKEVYLSDDESFEDIAFDLSNTNPKARVLSLYQKAIKQGSGITKASYDVYRLNYVRNHYMPNEQADSLYIKSLLHGLKHGDKVAVNEYLHAVVLYYMGEGSHKEVLEIIERYESKASADLQKYLKQVKAEIYRPSIQIDFDQVYTSSEKITWTEQTRNIDQIHYALYEVDRSIWRSLNTNKDRKRLLDKQKPIEEWTSNVSSPSYESTSTERSITAKPYGHYVIRIVDKGSTDHIIPFFVSDLVLVDQRAADQNKLIVANRLTGEPVQDAEVLFYKINYYDRSRSYELVKKILSDKNGVVSINEYGVNYVVAVRKGSDFLDLESGVYAYREGQQNAWLKSDFFTDRAIYRPGQSVYFKTIALQIDPEGMPKLHTETKEVVELYDANNQKIDERTFVTNNLGSGSGVFTLPEGLLKGNYSLRTRNSRGYTQIRVEEYKRPAMEVKVDSIKGQFVINEDYKLMGYVNYLNGIDVDKATISYRVLRQEYAGWRCYYRPTKETVVSVGELVSEKGKFVIPLHTETDGAEGTFTFRVEITVTESSGETVFHTWSQAVSTKPYYFELEGSSSIDISKESQWRVWARTLSSNSITVPAVLSIIRIENNEESIVSQQEVEVSKNGYEIQFGKYGTGEYLVKIENKNDGIVAEKKVVVFDYKKGHFPKVQKLYYSDVQDRLMPGEVLEVELGTSDPDMWVHYCIVNHTSIVSEGWTELSNTSSISYEVQDSDRGVLALEFWTIKDGQKIVVNKSIEVPWTDKEAVVKLKTSKDKTKPGSKEVWMVSVKDANGKKLSGELVATMYDASLDLLMPHQFGAPFFPMRQGALYTQWYGFDRSYPIALHKGHRHDYYNYYVQIPRLKTLYDIMPFGNYYGGGMRGRLAGRSYAVDGVRMKSAPMHGAEPEIAMMDASPQNKSDEKSVVEEAEVVRVDQKKEESIRENLDELVFFYPQIPIDNGEGKIEFTMNDALTKWKMKAFFHDSELRSGSLMHEVVTTKELMIKPNWTRFLREGDEVIFPANIFNVSDKEQEISSGIELYDAVTDEVISSIKIENINTSHMIEAGGSAMSRWKLHVPRDFKRLVKVKVWAESENHRDVQIDYLPVLTSQELITKTEAWYVEGGKSKQIELSGNKLDNLVVEYTHNPVWNAVQALPYIVTSDKRFITNVMDQYFVNKVARNIVENHPSIQRTIKAWKINDADALRSNLVKNEDVKNIALQATPWVQDSQNETEQKRLIQELFNDNNLNAQHRSNQALLRRRQNSDGGFSWIAGGRSDVYMTQYIVYSLSRLTKLGIDIGDLQDVATKAISYLDREMERKYKDVVQDQINKDSYTVSGQTVDYIYIKVLNGSVQKGKWYSFFENHMYASWTKQPLSSQIKIGMIAKLDKKNDLANKIWKSIEEQSFENPTLGKYWNKGNGFNWQDMPIDVHALAMEYYSMMDKEEYMPRLTKWLLNKKRTQRWSTPRSSVSAVYGLLVTDDTQGLAKNDPPYIYVNGNLMKSEAEIGTGYQKLVFPNGMYMGVPVKRVKIVNNGTSQTWAGIYQQYFEDQDKVVAANETPLSIERTLYKECEENGKPLLKQVTEGTLLEVGDRIISRLEIKSVSSMDYIHVKDLRAAGLESEGQISGYAYSDGLSYYQSPSDLGWDVFITNLPKGTYVLEYPSRVVHRGVFLGGFAKIQSMYVPEFSGNSSGKVVTIR